MRKLFEFIDVVGPTDSTVLVLGESGTGKELVARAIHRSSPRADHALVPVNCGAIPAELLESELFGHVKGAFTGAAHHRTGRFELADGGTILLDEIAEMSPALQVKLLRVLQERCVDPVGSTRSVDVDVRIICATNRDLEEEVAAGRFREDLYYRLNVLPIELPPLRSRASDVPLLLEHFGQVLALRSGRCVAGFTSSALTALCRYAWPGNVRELQNIVERLSVFHDGQVVDMGDLPTKILNGGRSPAQRMAPLDLPDEGLDLRQTLSRIEDHLIRQALHRTDWNKNRAAELLRMNRTTLVEKLKKRDMLNRRAASAPNATSWSDAWMTSATA